MGQHKALATPGNSEHKGVHWDAPRPNPQSFSGIGWLVTQLSLKFPKQSKAKLGTTNFLTRPLDNVSYISISFITVLTLTINTDLHYFIPVQKAKAE